ncbi:hypothetical protein LF1_57330 [Rubripirellula obstinata]|uniref:Uncharacterized protein n=1 Tax=Rubripirellula obstinata TaxID=406547 RepID=A0A5B1C7C1_9BACT|nr:hypothetical protein LF1_57540 [Rubripirellula obstinata]KAA1256987.1 hypothetical protein LF1_57330 [Rubripirellula obstinata]
MVTYVDEVRTDGRHRNGVFRITIACTGVAAAHFPLCLHVKSRHLGDAYRYPTEPPMKSPSTERPWLQRTRIAGPWLMILGLAFLTFYTIYGWSMQAELKSAGEQIIASVTLMGELSESQRKGREGELLRLELKKLGEQLSDLQTIRENPLSIYNIPFTLYLGCTIGWLLSTFCCSRYSLNRNNNG